MTRSRDDLPPWGVGRDYTTLAESPAAAPPDPPASPSLACAAAVAEARYWIRIAVGAGPDDATAASLREQHAKLTALEAGLRGQP